MKNMMCFFLFICVAFCMYGAAQTITPSSWVPSNLGAKLSQNPVTGTDAQIRALIDAYQKGIDTLDQGLDIVQRCLPSLKENVFILYREYNQNHTRANYESPDFTVTECLNYLQSDMDFYLSRLCNGVNPDIAAKGSYMPKAYWLPEWEIMGRYDAIIPNTYDARASWPLILSTQDDPGMALKPTPYILARCIKKGYQNNDTKEQAKNKAVLLDMAYDFNINPLRLFATGFSKGGHQSLKLGIRYPDWYAGIIAVHHDLIMESFPVQWEALMDLINAPTLLVHSTMDGYFQDTTVKYMLQNGCPVHFINDGHGHDADWLFRQNVDTLVAFCDGVTLDPYPKKVRHTVEHKRYSRAYWTNMRAIMDENLINAQYEIEVTGDNIIEIRLLKNAAKIQGFDFYLNDQIVDMGRPVKIIYNTDTVFNGMPTFRTSVTLLTGPTTVHANIVSLLWQQIDNIRIATFGASTQVQETASAWPHKEQALFVSPNPFNPTTKITFDYQKGLGSAASIVIFDLQGRIVANLTPSSGSCLKEGVVWNAAHSPSGVYFVQAKAGGVRLIKRVTLMK
ncbi:MAG: hypothetical protein A2268_06905 [Candidatus Raymondbacteria bacterium RifOxyA12_full_50_37]|uniref:Secretion system C-terminal sorting domain-containing protein n=1 Tax=Candidatus Raymondbacteria bacterium RIFOXYD12_FULL_49_13 TaxID=1817890 RepID=A0A1F7FEC7_UNCRA|nr:MAG: hypothetical protein A2268_06905 [Candidatus Raymondbacteria bacterium RifOxyA12_full_50_37]OGJ91116.1 MAG: hypothetical protein A2248_01060 [Candidatus Raymondbacteria bacterium RIFOXYA2_FULL_49_16]OGJ97513.1 MAG: hypothetical protein A2453_01820 [Candidatus Raymondbacteria bacterium RIFOXYC2_FULL_50_21]OGJ99612.1 MAG: hypothetical protein A2487_07840 [Candidatus Raymondbacteria bacterium RifOxyC12_full_50_8]OGK04988.1 MAG: hypothetical protein A2519_09930 [Candidatus Raymondbacteria b